MSVPLKAALINAREKLLQRAVIHVPLKLVPGHPNTEAVNLVLRCVLVYFGIPVVLKSTLKGQRFDSFLPRLVQVGHVHVEDLEQCRVDQRVLFVAVEDFFLSVFLALVFLALVLAGGDGQEGGQVGILVCELAASRAGRECNFQTALAVVRVAFERHGKCV